MGRAVGLTAAVAALAALLVVALGPVLPTPLKEAVNRLRGYPAWRWRAALVGRFSQSEWIHGVHWPVAVAASFNAPIPSDWLKRATRARTESPVPLDVGPGVGTRMTHGVPAHLRSADPPAPGAA
jgi:hypothetical protein